MQGPGMVQQCPRHPTLPSVQLTRPPLSYHLSCRYIFILGPRSCSHRTSQGNPEPNPTAGKMGVLIYTRKQVKCALTCESRGSMSPPFITAAGNPSLSLPLALEVLWALCLCVVTTPSIHEDISSGAMLFP